MVSKAREDLPEPLRPVKTTRRLRGIVSETFFRLCSRAPPMRMRRCCWVPVGAFFVSAGTRVGARVAAGYQIVAIHPKTLPARQRGHQGARVGFITLLGGSITPAMHPIHDRETTRAAMVGLAEYLRDRAGLDSRIVTTHEEIASDLGTAREVVSRLLSSFAQQGAIALSRGCIRVKRPDRLFPLTRP
jgi:hypothetical protein